MSHRSARRLDLAIGLALILATVLVYGQVAGHDFVLYDDPTYVVDNARVRAGLSVENVAWAFTTLHFSNWHPLTWLSYMLDAQIFGVHPGAMHEVNVALHATNAVLVYAALLALTGARWRSALVAGLFALHPLHVESVAWISERKDVLSTLFGLLAILVYAAYAKRGGRARYLACAACLCLGLLAKAMLVTWPFVFLLLDHWPLARLRGHGWQRIAEKLPLFALAAIFSIVALVAQARGGALIEQLSLSTRAANAAIAYVAYLGKTVWPVRLAPFYPHSGEHVPTWPVIGSLALLVGLTAACLAARRVRPYLEVGWLFYLVTLVPVIGLVQVGSQALADRYTFVPLLGIFIAAAWALGDAVRRRPALRPLAVWGSLVVLALLGVQSHAQVARWRDTLTLFAHALAVTPDNAVSRVQYANALQDAGRIDEAIGHYRAALALAASDLDAQVALGNALLKQGRLAEATPLLQAAVAAHPESELAQMGLGNARLEAGDLDGALAAFVRAVELAPALAPAHNAAGVALARAGKLRQAVAQFERALELRPDLEEAARNLETARRELEVERRERAGAR